SDREAHSRPPPHPRQHLLRDIPKAEGRVRPRRRASRGASHDRSTDSSWQYTYLVKHLGDSDIARDQASPAALPQLNLGGMPRCLLNCNVRATHRIVALRYADSALIRRFRITALNQRKPTARKGRRKMTRLMGPRVPSGVASTCEWISPLPAELSTITRTSHHSP